MNLWNFYKSDPKHNSHNIYNSRLNIYKYSTRFYIPFPKNQSEQNSEIALVPFQRTLLAAPLTHEFIYLYLQSLIQSNILDISVTLDGNYMATSSMDSSIRIWDLRTWKNIAIHRLPKGARNIQFSQKGKLATAFENVVEVWNGEILVICTTL